MTSGVRSGLPFITSFVFIFNVLLTGCIQNASAANTCNFNGIDYAMGDVIVSIPDLCTTINCQPKRKRNDGISRNGAELVITDQDLSTCSCNVGSGYTTNLQNYTARVHDLQNHEISMIYSKNLRKRDLSLSDIQSSLSKALEDLINPILSHLPLRHHAEDNNNSSRFWGRAHRIQRVYNYSNGQWKSSQREWSTQWNSTEDLRAKRGTPECKFNEQNFMVGETVASLLERCFELVCVQNNDLGVLKAQYIPSCTCGLGSGGAGKLRAAVSGKASGEGGLRPGIAPTLKCSDYSSFTSDHSVCKPKSTTCKVKREFVTNAEKRAILKAHNTFRAKVANGLETRGNPGPQPSATNMREIKWNDELAKVAQAWAFTCPSGHDCYDCRKIKGRSYYVGQNLYWSWSFTAGQEWQTAITAFYDEVQYVPNTLVSKYQSINTASDIGHYTQLVWAETYEIGCGAIYYGPCTRNGINFEWCKVYACDYGPAGNFIDNPIYKAGPAASNCPKKKSTKYKGLCK